MRKSFEKLFHPIINTSEDFIKHLILEIPYNLDADDEDWFDRVLIYSYDCYGLEKRFKIRINWDFDRIAIDFFTHSENFDIEWKNPIGTIDYILECIRIGVQKTFDSYQNETRLY